MFPVLAGSNPSGYNLTRSLRFRRSAGGYLNRTAGAGNQQIMTLSFWFKRGVLGVAQYIFGSYSNGSAYTNIYIESTDQIGLADAASGTNLLSTQVFRDPSAWYHIVVAIDTTQATAANRVKFYVNNVQITAFASSTYPAQNTNLNLNSAVNHTFFNNAAAGATNYTDGYAAEVNFIGASQLTPSSFGSTNSVTGVWQPARYTGTYGTNGFYLPFTDNSGATATTIGKDFSGNGNNWTPNNISVTAGVTYDSMTDVPTLTSATAANFAVLNPLDNGGLTITNGNLNASRGSGSSWVTAKSTIGVASGKWYWEFTSTVNQSAGGPNQAIGISKASSPLNTYLGSDANSWSYFQNNGNKWTNNTGSAYGSSWASGDVIGVALDVDNGTLTFYKNNVSQGTAFTGLTSGFYFPSVSMENGSAGAINFGQRPFTYTPPSGFVALNTFNLPTSTIVKGNTVMDATLYTANASTQVITNAAGFKPDFVWTKSRTGAYSHQLWDSIRGVNTWLQSNSTTAEQTGTAQLTSFNSNGFTLGANENSNYTNGYAAVGWQWQAGQGTTSTNTNGTITSTVSVNASAGFSVVTYTGNGTNGATVGHGLGVAPKMLIAKNRSTGSTDWPVWHTGLSGNSYYLLLDSNVAQANTWAEFQGSNSSTFTIGNDNYINANGSNYVVYAWSQIAGYSAFGSYTGNGSSDGTFVYTGFRPRYICVKSSSNVTNWYVFDTARNTYNLANLSLFPNLSNAENTGGNEEMDILSNGFKPRSGSASFNVNGYTYIYMAFAENPFKNALAR